MGLAARCWLVVLGVACTGVLCAGETKALARLRGIDFQGGGAAHFGSRFHGREDVNYVYAQPTGAAASLRGVFTLAALPGEPAFLFVEALGDERAESCRIELTLNGRALVAGPSGFPSGVWQVRRIAIPPDALKAGENEIAITNREPAGRLGMPPWFMVASCVVAGEGYKPPAARMSQELVVELPTEVRPLPEPLPTGQTQPGFRLRGIKGWMWKAHQYLSEIPVLAAYRMNFLMNCYTSMWDIERQPGWARGNNRWWELLTPEKRRAYEEVVRSCQKHAIQFCFSTNPNLNASRFVDPDKKEDLDALWQHYAWMQGLGVKWFNICLDDIGQGIDGAKHARLVNEFLRRLRAADPDAQVIFCPTVYAGTGQSPKDKAYLVPLAEALHPDVYLFWTGDGVITPRITRKAAEAFKSVARHRLILWDNYPVNDANPTLHLGPVTGRDADLCEVIEGYMGNPLCPQNEINRVPLLTCADYAYNPKAYDPARSIGQAIVHLAETDEQRGALKDLVEAYPGMLIFGGGSATNPVRERYKRLAAGWDAQPQVQDYLGRIESLAARFRAAFPGRFLDAQSTLAADLAWLKQAGARK